MRHTLQVRVLIAPDSFGGTLSASQAARSIAAGWHTSRPGDQLIELPLSDGGPGFVEVLAHALGGERTTVTVAGPRTRPVSAGFLLHEGTAYVESAQACGLQLLSRGELDPTLTTTYGVGELVAAARRAGATKVVVGLGGSATNDGGAGLLAAWGVWGVDAVGERLAPGGLALAAAVRIVGTPHLDGCPEESLAGLELIAATDVNAPLLGPRGASEVFGPQKGASPEQVRLLDAALAHWADLLEAHLGVAVRDLPGAGAAGGLGAALLAVGARRRSGFEVVAEAVQFGAALAKVDVVLTGEGSFDASSLSGKVVSGVAAQASGRQVPCVVLAGQVSVGNPEAAAAGVGAAHSMREHVGLDRALGDPAHSLASLAAQVAAGWSM